MHRGAKMRATMAFSPRIRKACKHEDDGKISSKFFFFKWHSESYEQPKNAVKALDKLQHLFLIKTLCISETEDDCLNCIKGIYKEPKAKLIVNQKKNNVLCWRLRTRPGDALVSLLLGSYRKS